MASPFTIRIRAVNLASGPIGRVNRSLGGLNKPIGRSTRALRELGAVGRSTFRQLSHALSGVGGSLGHTLDRLAEFSAVGIAASVGAIAYKFGEFGFQLNRSSRLLGMNAQDLASWHVAAQQAGVSADAFDEAMSGSQMAIRAAAIGANPQALVLMQKMGVQIERNKDGTIDYYTTQMRLMDAIRRQPTVEAQRYVAGVFGVSSLLPMIQQGTYAADKAAAMRKGMVPSPEELARAEQFWHDVTGLKQSAEGLAMTIGSRLLPILDPLVNRLADWLDAHRAQVADRIAEAVQRFVNWLSQIDWDNVGNQIKKVWDDIDGFKGVLIAIAAVNLAGILGGVVGLTGAMAKLGALAVPPAIAALSALATIPGFVATLGMLFPTELNQGEGAYLAEHGAKPGQAWTGDVAGARRTAANAGDTEERKRYFFARFLEAGYTPEQAAGALGSTLQENATLNPATTNASGHVGIAQWDAARARLFEKAHGKRLGEASFAEQVDYMLEELRTTEQEADTRLRNTRSAQSAAWVHGRFYERAGADINLERRGRLGEQMYASLPAQMAAYRAAAANAAATAAGNEPAAAEAATPAAATPADTGRENRLRELQGQVPQVHVTVNNALPGTRVEAKDEQGGLMPTRINYAMGVNMGAMP